MQYPHSASGVKTNPLPQAMFIIGERMIFLVRQVTIFVLVSRFLGREFFGQYTLVLTWMMLFQTFANFGVTECLAKEIGREPQQVSTYFTHGLVLAVAFAVVAMVVMIPVLWAMRYPLDVATAILLAGGTLLPAGVIGACRGVLLAIRKVEYMTAVGLAENCILLSFNVYWVVTGAGLLPIVSTIVAAKVVASGLAFAAVHRFVTPVVSPLRSGVFRHLWNVALPFGIAAQLPAIRFDIFLLSKMATFAALGLYSAGAKVAELLLMFPLAFYLTMLPRVAGDLAEKPARRTDRLRDALAWYFALVIPIGMGLIGLAEPIIRLIYGDAFIAAVPLLQIQAVAFLFTAFDTMLMMLCRATGFQRADLRLVFVSGATNLGLNLVLIPSLGAAGAALAVALAILTGLILRWRLVGRRIIQLDWHRLVGAPLAASVVLVPALLALTERIPWPVLATGYALVYATIALMAFPFVSEAVKRASRQRGISAS